MRRPPAKKRTANESDDRSEATNEVTSEATVSTSVQPRKKKRVQDIDITEEEDETYEQNVVALIVEAKKNTPSKRTVASLMEKTLSKHRQWIMKDCPKVDEIFTSFPPLSQSFKNVSCTLLKAWA